MKIPQTIFRQYDIRGIVAEQLTPDVARAVGAAFATFGRRRLSRAPTLAVGRDNRPSGPDLARHIRAGIVAAGGRAVDVGECPTPALYFATHTLEVDGGLQVTGSHNPPEFNGFKMVLAGEAVAGDAIQDLYRMIAGDALDRVAGGAESTHAGLLPAYRDAIVTRNAPLARPVKVVVDCGNGVTSLIAIETLRAVGATVVPLFAESDGRFPNHHPDPSVPENLEELAATVAKGQGEIGLAFDGDGDRLGIVTPRGHIIFPDRQLMLFAAEVLGRQPGATVVFDVKCTRNLAPWITRHGGKPLMWKTGHSWIKGKMRETEAALGGEMSGHLFFKDRWYGFDDGLYAGARLLEILSRGADAAAPLEALPDAVNTP